MRNWGIGRGGFALVEATAVVGLCVAVCCVAAVVGREQRFASGMTGSLANLKKHGELTGGYAADRDDAVWTLDWSVDNAPSDYPDLQNPGTHLRAIEYQVVDIVRRRYDETAPRLSDRLPSYWLSTLVLADHFDEALPLEWAVSPGDRVRLAWQSDPDNPPQLGEQGGDAWSYHFAGFGSSYELMPAYFSKDQRDGSGDTLYQYSGYHNLTYVPSSLQFGGRRLAEVEHPSRKVHLAERASFFAGPRIAHYLHREARVPVLMADGSVAARTSADANASFRPNNPDNPASSTAHYVPNTIYEPPALSGGTQDSTLETHYKWSRRGLRGLDFDGARTD